MNGNLNAGRAKGSPMFIWLLVDCVSLWRSLTSTWIDFEKFLLAVWCVLKNFKKLE